MKAKIRSLLLAMLVMTAGNIRAQISGSGTKQKTVLFMISATWNAAAQDFNDTSQYLFQGKGPSDVLFNITTNYRFSGYEILRGYNCFDVFHNTHITKDLENYPAHLKMVLGL